MIKGVRLSLVFACIGLCGFAGLQSAAALGNLVRQVGARGASSIAFGGQAPTAPSFSVFSGFGRQPQILRTSGLLEEYAVEPADYPAVAARRLPALSPDEKAMREAFSEGFQGVRRQEPEFSFVVSIVPMQSQPTAPAASSSMPAMSAPPLKVTTGPSLLEKYIQGKKWDITEMFARPEAARPEIKKPVKPTGANVSRVRKGGLDKRIPRAFRKEIRAYIYPRLKNLPKEQRDAYRREFYASINKGFLEHIKSGAKISDFHPFLSRMQPTVTPAVQPQVPPPASSSTTSTALVPLAPQAEPSAPVMQRLEVSPAVLQVAARSLLSRRTEPVVPLVSVPTPMPLVQAPSVPELSEPALAPEIEPSALVPYGQQAAQVETFGNSALLVDVQQGLLDPSIVLQYIPPAATAGSAQPSSSSSALVPFGQQAGGTLVIQTPNKTGVGGMDTVQFDLSVFDSSMLSPELKTFISRMQAQNEPVALALYQPAGHQNQFALVPTGQASSSSGIASLNQIGTAVADAFADAQTMGLVLRVQAEQTTTPPALPAPQAEQQAPIAQPPRSAQAEPSEPRRQPRQAQEEPSIPRESHVRHRVEERQELQPRIEQRRQPDLAQREEALRRQQAAIQAAEQAFLRQQQEAVAAQQRQHMLEQQQEQDRQALLLSERERMQQQQAQELAQRAEQERLQLAERQRVEREHVEQVARMQRQREREEFLDEQERQRLEQLRLRQEERRAAEFLRAQEQAEQRRQLPTSLPPVQSPTAPPSVRTPTVAPPTFSNPLAGPAGPSAPAINPFRRSTPTGSPTGPSTSSLPGAPPTDMPAGTGPAIGPETGRISRGGSTGETGYDGDRDRRERERAERDRRERGEAMRTPIDRHRAAILDALRHNRAIPQGIIQDFYVYSSSIFDMLSDYNRQLKIFRCVRPRQANQGDAYGVETSGETYAIEVLERIKRFITQMMHKQALSL